MDPLAIDIALPRRAFELRAALTLAAETVALVGPSGAGKTSLLRAVAGLERPSSGRIALGEELWFDAERRVHLGAERRRVGYLPQDYGLFPHLTVAGNVRFAGKHDRPDLLARMGISHLSGARPRQLSGGERQRTALARALAREPRVLLLDEPFGALDAITRQQVRDQLGDLLAELNLPALIVSHSFEDALVLGRRVGVLDRGRLVQLGSASELRRSPQSAMVAALTGANVLRGIATRESGGSTIRLSAGGQLTSSTAADGPVEIAIQPWEVALGDPDSCALTDTVVNVREDHGGLVVRLTRLTVHVAAADLNGHLAQGQAVGVRVAPGDVRVIAGPVQTG
jgi:ABC-type sulfate/molybdate transport systems ATPase subunit